MINEATLISEKRITTWQLQEIKRLFEMIDIGRTGELTMNDIGFMMQKVCKGVTVDELQEIFRKIVSPGKTSISRNEFLCCILIFHALSDIQLAYKH